MKKNKLIMITTRFTCPEINGQIEIRFYTVSHRFAAFIPNCDPNGPDIEFLDQATYDKEVEENFKILEDRDEAISAVKVYAKVTPRWLGKYIKQAKAVINWK